MATNAGIPDPHQATTAKADSPKSESFVTVVIALAANALIAIVKSIVAAISGSASLVAEAAHSWADTGNEVFLLMAEKRSQRPADEFHPVGYGRAAYVWSMLAAFGLFSVGATVSVVHGIQSWNSTDEGGSYLLGYIVLAISFVLEGISFLRARGQVRANAAERGISSRDFLGKTSDPTVRAVFVEDAAALIGLVLAAAGMALHQVTGDARWDAAGSILVGILLGIIATWLFSRNMDFLIGEVADPQAREEALTWLLARPEIASVSYLYLEFVGPQKVLIIGSVDLTGDDPESKTAVVLQRIEDALQEHPSVAQAVISLSSPNSKPLAAPQSR